MALPVSRGACTRHVRGGLCEDSSVCKDGTFLGVTDLGALGSNTGSQLHLATFSSTCPFSSWGPQPESRGSEKWRSFFRESIKCWCEELCAPGHAGDDISWMHSQDQSGSPSLWHGSQMCSGMAKLQITPRCCPDVSKSICNVESNMCKDFASCRPPCGM